MPFSRFPLELQLALACVPHQRLHLAALPTVRVSDPCHTMFSSQGCRAPHARPAPRGIASAPGEREWWQLGVMQAGCNGRRGRNDGRGVCALLRGVGGRLTEFAEACTPGSWRPVPFPRLLNCCSCRGGTWTSGVRKCEWSRCTWPRPDSWHLSAARSQEYVLMHADICTISTASRLYDPGCLDAC